MSLHKLTRQQKLENLRILFNQKVDKHDRLEEELLNLQAKLAKLEALYEKHGNEEIPQPKKRTIPQSNRFSEDNQ